MHLMDVVTAYLYSSLDSEIYMKIPKGFKMLETYKSSHEQIRNVMANLIYLCV